jgi:uncharacterized protein
VAKKGYPGLVLVPPSDRTILRRRLLRGGLFIIALVWCASILTQWPPASDDRANCQPGAGQESGNSSLEKCGHPQSATEAPSNQNEFSLTQLSQAEGLIEPQNPPASATPDPNGSATKDDPGQDLKPKTSDPTPLPRNPYDAHPANEKSASTPPAPKPIHDPDLDARLAEQGDAFAQYRLGRYYAQRDGRQTPESVGWYKKAASGLHRLAETGNGQAMYVLGVMYAYGRGVPRDTEQARRWLAQAVEQKVTAAQPVLAKLAVQPPTTSNPKTAGREKVLQEN